MLTNVEKSLILQALQAYIGDLVLIQETKDEKNKNVESQRVEINYQEVINDINRAYNSPLKGNEFDNKRKVGLFTPAGLEKVVNKLRALFHPDYETFKTLQIIHNPIYKKNSLTSVRLNLKRKFQQ